ncbi:hypothetical protein [Enterobacter asburiae]|uniref:hypothetical protein n=1 Tax=Enterobacter asburiae TaxID=61645 RepID=UPI003CEEFBAD
MKLIDELIEIYDTLNKHPLLQPPYEHKGNLISDFNERIECYLRAIDEIALKHPDNNLIKKIKKRKITISTFSEKITDTLAQYLRGNIREAYTTFDQAITRTTMNTHIYNMTRPLSKIGNKDNLLFRVRSSDTILKERKELFHIPFEDRHRVGAMRFSVSGLPCLYLGSSIFVCWQEMGKPDFDKLYISSFKTDEETDDLRILDLGYNLTSAVKTQPLDRFIYFDIDYNEESEPEEINDIEINYQESNNNYGSWGINNIISKLLAWPLVLACNYSKYHSTANFHKEYIIPNLLMQWISSDKNKDISGISYRSTKILNQKNKSIGINVIIPPKMEELPIDYSGHCPVLKRTFLMTNPVSWTVFSTLDIIPEKYKGDSATASDDEHRFSSGSSSKIESLDESLVELYERSTFRKVELLIDQKMNYKRIP